MTSLTLQHVEDPELGPAVAELLPVLVPCVHHSLPVVFCDCITYIKN